MKTRAKIIALLYLGLCPIHGARGQDDNFPASEDFPSADEVVDLGEIEAKDHEGWQSVSKKDRIPPQGISIEEIVEPPVEYHYSAFGQPNPFAPPQIKAEDQAGPIATLEAGEVETKAADVSPAGIVASGAEIPVVSPLQRFPLKALKLKGIWLLSGGNKKALVMTPKREGVIVKEGDPISAGKVLEIKKNQVVVRQYRIRRDGAREYSDKFMYLGDAEPDEHNVVTLKPGKEPRFDTPPVEPKKEFKPVPAPPRVEEAKAPPPAQPEAPKQEVKEIKK